MLRSSAVEVTGDKVVKMPDRSEPTPRRSDQVETRDELARAVLGYSTDARLSGPPINQRREHHGAAEAGRLQRSTSIVDN